MARPEQSKVPLSVVITTVSEPGSVIEKLDSLRRQVAELSGELLIVSSVKPASPPPSDIRVHHVAGGGSIFDCRAEALSLASGEIIAFTEDHCEHPPDWCERILRTFSLRPDLVLLGGAVANGSTRRIDDLMNYWTTFSPYAPGQVTARQPCIAQFIVKASAIGRPLKPGEMEYVFTEKLRGLPGAIYVDPDLIVTHEQSHGLWKTFAVHFHNGRATGGLSPRRVGDRNLTFTRSLRYARRDLIAHFKSSKAAFRAGKKPFHIKAAYLMMILPLIIAHGIGAWVGYRKGPGASPHRLV
jgi:hypothetical protein